MGQLSCALHQEILCRKSYQWRLTRLPNMLGCCHLMVLLVILSMLVTSGSGTKVLVPAYWGATTDSDGNCNESQFEALAAGSKVAVIVNANSGPITPENGY